MSLLATARRPLLALGVLLATAAVGDFSPDGDPSSTRYLTPEVKRATTSR